MGQDKGRQATIVSTHRAAAGAFKAVEQIAQQIARSGGRLDGIELLVVDEERRVIPRPGVG